MLSRVTFWAHDNSQQQQKKKCLKSWYMNVLSAVQIDSMLFSPVVTMKCMKSFINSHRYINRSRLFFPSLVPTSFFPCLKCLLFFSSPIAINFLQIHNNLKQSMRCDPIQCGRGGKETENILMVCQISQSEYAVRISLGIRIAYLSRWSIQMVNFSLPFIFFRTLCSSHCDFSHILHYFWHWFAGYYFIMLECKM